MTAAVFAIAYAAEARAVGEDLTSLRREVALSRTRRSESFARIVEDAREARVARVGAPDVDARLAEAGPLLARARALPRAELVVTSDGPSFSAWKIASGLAAEADRAYGRGDAVLGDASIVRSAILASSLRGSGSVPAALLASRAMEDVATVVDRHRARIGDAARADLAAVPWPTPAELGASLRVGRARTILGWADGPPEGRAERVFVRGLVREEMALDAMRSADRELATFAAAYREEASPELCTAAMLEPSGVSLCRQLDRLREGDRAVARLR